MTTTELAPQIIRDLGEKMAYPAHDNEVRFLYKNRLVYCKTKADKFFWDEHWSELDLSRMLISPRSNMVEGVTEQYLPKGSTVIEGGCGPALTVEALRKKGYFAIGIDFASSTLRRVKHILPEADLTEGNVFSLPLKSQVADGYWSLGVIEHFIDGYTDILKEAERVIKQDGFIFLTFPYMSPLRRLKAKLGLYQKIANLHIPDHLEFYQFALTENEVASMLRQNGFSVLSRKPYDGLKGLKDEVSLFTPVLSRIYNSKSLIGRIVRRALNMVLSRFSGHIVLIVAQKNS